MKNKSLSGVYFCGNKASNYAIENGYLDYATLAKAFDAVLANDIISKTYDVLGCWEIYNGDECYYTNDNGDEISVDEYWENGGNENYLEFYQYYIISDNGAQILSDWTNETVWYNETLDLYVWGVTHWGTSWDYVLTNIKLNGGYDNE